MTIPADAWHIDPVTLRDVADDRPALEAALIDAAPPDRVFLLRILGRVDQAIAEGEKLLAGACDWRTLLLVAHAYEWNGEFARAAALQRRALALADTPSRLATTQQHIGKRLFDEGLYGKALLKFEEALATRTLIDPELARSSQVAVDRVHELLTSS